MKYLDFLTLYFDEGGAEGGAPAEPNGGQPAAEGGNPAPADNGGDDRDKPKYTDADLDKIIEKKLAKWKRQTKAEVDEATRLANMNAQERAEHERDKYLQELNDLKHANTMAEMERNARNILSQDGIHVSDDIVATLVDEDADKTSENVKAFSKAFKKAVQEEVKRQLSHKTPASGSHSNQLTSADIMKEKDPIKRQKLIRENMSLFKH